MFRYLGFAWDPEQAGQAIFAQRLDESIRHAKGWQPALSNAGLRIHAIGSRPGINDVHRLRAGQGVVLGRLFRRKDGGSGRRDIDLSVGEGNRILHTNGRALVDGYWGRYVAVLRSVDGRAFILRDPSGALPCFQCNVEGVTVFFSWLEDFLEFAPGVSMPRVNWDAIGALLSIGHLGGRDTALQGVSQILPGHLTPLRPDAAPPITLWSAAAVARKQADEDPELATARLRQAVMDCIGAWSSCYGRVLLRLSGGVDSAILLGGLRTMRPGAEITCLNYHSPGSDSDERGFARLAAAKAGVELVERERDASFRLDDILAVSRTPVPEGYTGRLGTNRTDAELADARRALAMFTGAGGDSLFFQLRCTWPAADYLDRHGFGRGFVRASLDAARLGRVSLWRSMRCALADQRHRTSVHEGVGRHFALTRREAATEPRHLDRYVHPDLHLASDLPIGKFHQVQYLINAVTYYDPYLREAAPEIVNPLLSQPLVEHCLALPTWVLTHGGHGRALARRAFARELPREIAMRQSKGGMEEHVETILQRNLPLVRSLLLDGQLVRQGLLDRRKVEAALADRPARLDATVGEIHYHVAIEAWLRQVAQPT